MKKENFSVWTRTKVICTLGPSVDSLEKIKKLLSCGMDVARLNFSHGTPEEHLKTFSLLKEARKASKKPFAILLDTKGPEIRVGSLPLGAIEINPGQRFKLISSSKSPDELPVHPFAALSSVSIGMEVLFDDGSLLSTIIERTDFEILIEFQNGGILKSKKGVNVPKATISLPSVTEEDLAHITFGCMHEIDFIAASFVRNAEPIFLIRKLLKEQGKQNIPIIAKIESKEGIENFEEILEASDGIMVARGDLGVEVGLSKIPRLQKMMIQKCYEKGKLVITATQMLESMIHNIRPTRAEVSDVANAVYDSSSAVMLSGETAIGKFPFETVLQMKEILSQTEKDFDYPHFFSQQCNKGSQNPHFALAAAAIQLCNHAQAKAIFLSVEKDFSVPQLFSSLRPEKPLFILTSNQELFWKLLFLWGVFPVFAEEKNEKAIFAILSKTAQKEKFLEKGDRVVFLHSKEDSPHAIFLENVIS